MILVGRLQSSVTQLEATVAIAALACCPKHGFAAGPAMPAFSRLALTTVALTTAAVKSLLQNFPHNPLGACPRTNDLLRTRSFGQLFRSISLNMNDYSPQLIEISDSKSHALATILILGQAPSCGD